MKNEYCKTGVFVILLSAFVIAGHLLPGLAGTEIEREIRNSLHFLGFALIAAVIFERLSMRTLAAALSTLLLVALLGLAAEFVQKLSGKGFDYFDWGRDLAGAALYLGARICWQWSGAQGRSLLGRSLLRLAAAGCGVLILVPLVYWLTMSLNAASRFPTILDFDGAGEMFTYQTIDANMELRRNESDPANQFALIVLSGGTWSGLKIDTVVADWSQYDYLTMRVSISAGADSGTISVHLSDVEHPGYRTQHSLGRQRVAAESSTLRFALRGAVDVPGRPDLEPGNIRQIYIIGYGRRDQSSTEIVLQLDDIKLE